MVTKNKVKKVSKKKIVKKPLALKTKKKVSDDNSTSKTKIRIIGIGGGGGSIISEISTDLSKIDFVAANTDKRSLRDLSRKVKTFHFGNKQTKGFGTGMDPELGKNAASEEKDKIKKLMEGQDVCILVASLGAGTGSGATPIFAKVAKESGCIVYGIFTLPFNFEGLRKMEIAKDSLEETRLHLNAISILPNENIFNIIDKNAPLKEALSIINKNLSESLKGLMEAIYNPGLINIDFADFKTILEGKGKITYLNTDTFDASKGAEDSLKKVINNPFYSYGINGSSGILLNVTGSKKIGLNDVSKISSMISGKAKRNASIIFGISHDDKYGDKIKITILAVGCEAEEIFSKNNEKKELILKKKPIKKKKEVLKNKKTEKDNKKKNNDFEDKVEIKSRRNALEVKKANEEIEKELLEDEKKWETPAFLRRGSLDKDK